MTQRIPLTTGYARTQSGLFTLVDDEDFEFLSTRKWRVFVGAKWGRVYAISNKNTLLHRFLLDAPTGMDVDHLNGDGLDNRRANIRIATHSQNLANQWPRLMYARRPASSKFKGVNLSEGRPRPWRATIRVETQQHFLGYHLTEEEAAKAYDVAAVRFFGPFARTNFPLEGA